MLALFAAALILTVCQTSASIRTDAEQLARAGRTAEAIDLFKRLVDQDPADVDARVWVARLNLRLGHTADAEAGFRSVLRDHPGDIAATVGLGGALIRRGAWADALTVLTEAESRAGANSDLYGVLARAYRAAGDDRRALAYYERARVIAPDDQDVVNGYEAVVRAYGHWIGFDGFVERMPGDNSVSGTLAGSVRVMPRLHLLASARAQERSGSSDSLGGAGLEWRAGRATVVAARALFGSGNTFLPTNEQAGEVTNYRGAFEMGGGIRRIEFADVDVIAVSPMLAWDTGERWRLDGRYTWSRSRFDTSGETSSDHSVLIRDTWRRWRRAWLIGAYAYGIESFEQLTADRIGSLGASTLAAGLRVNAPSHTVLISTWEHQWRSNATSMDRLTVAIVQSFP